MNDKQDGGEKVFPLGSWFKAKNISHSHGYKMIREGKVNVIKIGNKPGVTESEDRRFLREGEAVGASEVRALGEKKRLIKVKSLQSKSAALIEARTAHKKTKRDA
jgi:GTP-sensing pleiotropic transcriptional regulator CodY